jgi:glycosyltransferase involved in cell wall biosynthesis
MSEIEADRSGGANSSVAILLGTKQGQPFLREQLDSILSQTHPHWSIWASDDGSTDGTLTTLAEYQHRLGTDKLSVATGPDQGFVKNFLTLVCNPKIAAKYYAYCDQDDIWEPGKLASALKWLETIPEQLPAMYCARTYNVSAKNNFLGLSPLFSKPPGFANALVQSIGGGNTMVFNHAACQLLRTAGAGVQVASHDWWTYLLVSGCGGQVFYDSQPNVRYRQHGGNLVGSSSTWIDRLERTGMLFRGRFRNWVDMNTTSLLNLPSLLTPDSAKLLEEFCQARSSGLATRVAGVKRSGVYRQTRLGHIGLVVAVLFKKI